MDLLVSKVNKRTKINITSRDVENILSATLSSSNLWEITDLSHRPFRIVVETLKELRERGLVILKNSSISLTKEGKIFCKRYNVTPKTNHGCPACRGRTVSLAKFEDFLPRFEQIVRNRPEPIMELDQGFVGPTIAFARIALLADRGDIQGKDVIILGDDDLVSLAAALSGLPKRITVLEVDERIVDFIENTSEKENLHIEVVPHDLRFKLPRDLVESFDTFLTDPPEAIGGLELFIARGLATLKGAGCAGYFGLTMIESSLQKWGELQKILTHEYGVVITDIIHDFNIYDNWMYLLESIKDDIGPLREAPEKHWYKSSMFRIETLEDFLQRNEDVVSVELYNDPESLIWTKER
ncbi:MAG: bis-aminopropyl spermidine synthase family protein [Actinomycetota bacterium]